MCVMIRMNWREVMGLCAFTSFISCFSNVFVPNIRNEKFFRATGMMTGLDGGIIRPTVITGNTTPGNREYREQKYVDVSS